MKFLFLAILLAFVPAALSANPTQLQSAVAFRQQRVDLLRGEMKQMDTAIESRLDVILNSLTSIADSKDSRTKVARIKEETIKRLGKTIQYYDQKRAAIREDLKNPRTSLTKEEKQEIINIFDERIEQRVQQVLALYKSMPGHQDYDRYKPTGGGGWGTEYQRNADYDQNRRMTSYSNTEQTVLVKQLDASIARLQQMRRSLGTQAAAATDPAAQRDLADQTAKIDALILERQKQKLDLLNGPAGSERSVPLEEAMSLDQAIDKAFVELRRDMTTLFARYNSYLAELSALRQVQNAAAASH